ncbi:putative 40S ribosomal protein S4-B, partial [Erysiphe pulchra]
MPRQTRSGGAGRAPSRPTIPARKPAANNQLQTRPVTSVAQPPAQAATPQQQTSAGSGLFGQMASTAAGVAVGSSIGHAIGSLFSGGSSQPVAEPQNNSVASQSSQESQKLWGGRSCEVDAEQFAKCMQEEQGNMQNCNWYLEKFAVTMGRGPKKHQKRLSAPSHWLLDKLSGAYAPRPSPGPHKLRECLPLIIFIRNRLKYALNARETKAIVMQRLIKVDGKVRTDTTYPAGFMDVISIEKTGEYFRLIYDTKGRFTVHRIQSEEAEYKLGKVKRVQLGKGGIPFLVTHDARTIRYPDPAIKVNDTVKIDLATGKITDFIKFDTGTIAMVTGGRNMGRIGVITHRERHDGGFNIVHLKDAIDNVFATRESNVFVIGSEKPWISLPKGKG